MARISHRNEGVMLTETIIALGVLGIAVVGLTTALSQLSTVRAQQQREGLVEELRYYVRNNINCSNSLSGASVCAPGSYLNLKDRSGQTVADQSGTGSPFGLASGLRLRAYCQNEGIKSLRIEYAFSQQDQWKDLFDGVPLSCCSAGDEATHILNSAAIRNIIQSKLGVTLAANEHIHINQWNTLALCLLAGYEERLDATYQTLPSSSCGSVRLGWFRDGEQSLFFRNACIPWRRAVQTITCRKKMPTGCDQQCPDVLHFDSRGAAASFVSSYIPETVASSWAGGSLGLVGKNYNSIVTYHQIRSVSKTADPSGGISARKLCQMRGYATSQIVEVKRHDSPSDNVYAYWSAAENKWKTGNAATLGNRDIGKLNCKDPLPSCRIGP